MKNENQNGRSGATNQISSGQIQGALCRSNTKKFKNITVSRNRIRLYLKIQYLAYWSMFLPTRPIFFIGIRSFAFHKRWKWVAGTIQGEGIKNIGKREQSEGGKYLTISIFLTVITMSEVGTRIWYHTSFFKINWKLVSKFNKSKLAFHSSHCSYFTNSYKHSN